MKRINDPSKPTVHHRGYTAELTLHVDDMGLELIGWSMIYPPGGTVGEDGCAQFRNAVERKRHPHSPVVIVNAFHKVGYEEARADFRGFIDNALKKGALENREGEPGSAWTGE